MHSSRGNFSRHTSNTRPFLSSPTSSNHDIMLPMSPPAMGSPIAGNAIVNTPPGSNTCSDDERDKSQLPSVTHTKSDFDFKVSAISSVPESNHAHLDIFARNVVG